MPINLVKGQNHVLNMNIFHVGLGWDVNEVDYIGKYGVMKFLNKKTNLLLLMLIRLLEQNYIIIIL